MEFSKKSSSVKSFIVIVQKHSFKIEYIFFVFISDQNDIRFSIMESVFLSADHWSFNLLCCSNYSIDRWNFLFFRIGGCLLSMTSLMNETVISLSSDRLTMQPGVWVIMQSTLKWKSFIFRDKLNIFTINNFFVTISVDPINDTGG